MLYKDRIRNLTSLSQTHTRVDQDRRSPNSIEKCLDEQSAMRNGG